MMKELLQELTMRHVPLFAIAALALAGCRHDTTAPNAQLQGDWRTAPIPSGSGTDLELVTVDQTVSGTGHQYVLQNLRYTFTVTGTVHSDETVQLTLTADDGTVFTFNGAVRSNNLEGDWVPVVCDPATCKPQQITFTRQAN